MNFLAGIIASIITRVLEKILLAGKAWLKSINDRREAKKKADEKIAAVKKMIKDAKTRKEKSDAAIENARLNGPSD